MYVVDGVRLADKRFLLDCEKKSVADLRRVSGYYNQIKAWKELLLLLLSHSLSACYLIAIAQLHRWPMVSWPNTIELHLSVRI